MGYPWDLDGISGAKSLKRHEAKNFRWDSMLFENLNNGFRTDIRRISTDLFPLSCCKHSESQQEKAIFYEIRDLKDLAEGIRGNPW